MPRTLTFPSVLACLVFAAGALLTLEPWSASRKSPCAFEVRVQSDHSGLVQLYYDVGRGFNEPESQLQPIVAGIPKILRFALPYGRFRALRFDPLDRDGRISVSDARVVDGLGRVLVAVAPEQFQAPVQLHSVVIKDGTLLIETEPLATDPSLAVRLQTPFVLERPPLWRDIGILFLAAVAALALCGGFGASRARSLWTAATASPRWSVAVAALLGTVAANAPILFAGRTLISPNLGVALLYGQNPWLPGFQSSEVGDPHKADIAALLWHHVPLSMIEHQALFRDAELPLWNRYDSGGLPLLGQGQSCFGDPLHFIPILANGAAWAWDLKFLLAKWAFAGGIGLCAWAAFRHLPTALLTAVSASFIGFFIYRINHPAIFSLCYSPWILYCWLRCADSRSPRSAILAMAALVGANWVEMNSGTAKEAYVLLLSMNFSGLCILLFGGRSLREKAGLLGGLVAAGIAFALIGSPVWYTFYRALRSSYTSYNIPLAFQIQPGMFIGLFDEAFYRPFQVDAGVADPAANGFILLGFLWCLVRFRSLVAHRTALALLLSALPAFALVFGVIPPALIARVPFLGNIQHVDNTLSCPLIVLLALLAGFGWREAWDRLASAEGRREAAIVVALLVALLAVYFGTAQSVLRSAYASYTWGSVIKVPPFIHAYGWSLVAGSALFLWALQRMRAKGVATPALVVFAVLGFGAFHWRSALKFGGAYPDYVVTPPRRVDLLAASTAVDTVLARRDSPARVLGFHNDLLPGWSIAYGLESISGPDALINPYYRAFMDAAGIKRVWDWRYIVDPPEVPGLKPFLDLLNVRFYLGYHLGEQRPGSALSPIHSSDMDVFESRSPWPRAFFTDSAAVYKDVGQLCSWIKAGDGRPFAGIQQGDWVTISPAPRVSGDLGTRKVNAAENYRLTSNTTSFSVTATGPGFIVLTEAFERGNFHATVNGKETPYLRINHAFKGIYVDEPGTYEVRFSYWPRGLTTSLILAAVGLGFLAAWVGAALLVPSRLPASLGPRA